MCSVTELEFRGEGGLLGYLATVANLDGGLIESALSASGIQMRGVRPQEERWSLFLNKKDDDLGVHLK